MPDVPAQVPMADARSSGAKLAWMTAKAPGVSNAPPTPCATRAAINWVGSAASEHANEAMAKRAMPTE